MLILTFVSVSVSGRGLASCHTRVNTTPTLASCCTEKPQAALSGRVQSDVGTDLSDTFREGKP